MSKMNFLEQIKVENPCTEDWNEMRGNEQIRFCSHCAKSVNNLSEMTRKEASKLIRQSNGAICVRYVCHPDGRIQTLKNTLHQITRQTGIAAGVLGTSLAMSAIAYAQTTAEPTSIEEVQIAEVANDELTAPNGTISGTITDPNGAVVPFAVVTIFNEQTYFSQITNADQEGFYEFKEVPNGDYKIKFEVNGFAVRELAPISVSGAQQTANAQMAIETVQEVVTVGGEISVTTVTMGTMASSYVRYNKLVAAVEDDDIERVKTLIAKGERVNAKDKGFDKNTPLHAAVENGNLEIVQILLNAGAKTSAKNNDKRTPLMMLDADSSPDIVRTLLNYGSRINLVDRLGNTALMLAAGNASAEVLQTLINAGANVNALNRQGETALMRAAENGELENVKTLLGAGANAQITTKEGATALSAASSEDVRQILIAYGGTELSEK